MTQSGDEEARGEIFRLYLHELPIEEIDYHTLSEATPHFSGADIAGLVDRVSESVIEEILNSGEELLISQEELMETIENVKPTTMEWFEMAKNVVEYANENGIYDELGEYLKNERGTKRKKMGFL